MEARLDDASEVFDLVFTPKGADKRMFGHLYCPGCGESRRMAVTEIERPFLPAVPLSAMSISRAERAVADGAGLPCLLEYACLQCGTEFSTVLDKVSTGELRVVALPRRAGGLSTPHTPPAVGYYLNEAYLARTMGAHSGAVAMYRAALEHILFEQGYTVRMFGPKIAALEAHRQSGAGPTWVRDLDSAFLRVIGELGNAAIHPGDGDISKQSAIDAELVHAVEATMLELLDLVYEIPHKRQARLAGMQSTAQTFKK